jgi:hypothetical protein
MWSTKSRIPSPGCKVQPLTFISLADDMAREERKGRKGGLPSGCHPVLLWGCLIKLKKRLGQCASGTHSLLPSALVLFGGLKVIPSICTTGFEWSPSPASLLSHPPPHTSLPPSCQVFPQTLKVGIFFFTNHLHTSFSLPPPPPPPCHELSRF